MELTDEELDLLLEDWFDRNEDTFVNVRHIGRVGWEKTLSEGEAYSSFLMEAPSTKELIKRAYPLANETIIAMEPPQKVTVKISSTGGSATDGKIVKVSTEVFDEPDLSNGEKLDVFLGLTVHEGCHLLWTDLKRVSFGEGRNHRIAHHIWNILEDERIENLCGTDKPGLARFLEKTKYYYFDMKFIDEIVEEELNDFETLMTTFLRIVRYPRYLSREDFKKFGDYLIRIKEVLVPYPDSPMETIEATKIIYDIIRDLFKDMKEEPPKKKSKKGGEPMEGMSGDGDSGEGEGSSFGEEEEDDGDGDKESEEETKKEPLTKEEIEELMSEESKDILEKMERLFGDTEGGGDIKTSKSISDLDAKVIEGTVVEGTEKYTFFERADDNRAVYMESYGRVVRYVPSIRKMIKGHCKEYKLIHKSMRSGTFDTTKLAEAYQGVPTVYMREGEVKTDKVAIVVLIDESGSMGGSKITSARDAAVLLNESFTNIPNVELYIYGHSGDILMYGKSTDLRVYRENGFAPKYALGSVSARKENRDGMAILTVAKRVRKQTKEHCLYFILSDGAPCAYDYHGASAMQDVKDKVIKTEKMGFSVIQICIDHSYNPATMFKNYVILDDISTLASNLGKLIKKVTIQNAKERVI